MRPVRRVKFRVPVMWHTGSDFPAAPPVKQIDSVGSFSFYFMVIDLLKAPLFLELHLLSPTSLKILATLLPFVPLGVIVGYCLNRRINDRIFSHVSYAFLLGLGIKLLVDALAT